MRENPPMTDPNITTIRERLDAASCRCVVHLGMQLSGECPVHGEKETNEDAYRALDAVERELADLRESVDLYEAMTKEVERSLFGADMGRSRDEIVQAAADLRVACEKAIRERQSLETKEDDWHRAYENAERRLREATDALRLVRDLLREGKGPAALAAVEGTSATPGEDCPRGGTHAWIRGVRCAKCGTGRSGADTAATPGEELCGSYGCTLPRGHNMGRLDIPENHRGAKCPRTGVEWDICSCSLHAVSAEPRETTT
jgi:hypothetical protein